MSGSGDGELWFTKVVEAEGGDSEVVVESAEGVGLDFADSG